MIDVEHTIRSTLLAVPDDSAVYTLSLEDGSAITALIFDGSLIGCPFLFFDLAALRSSTLRASLLSLSRLYT